MALPRCKAHGYLQTGISEVRLFRVKHPHAVDRTQLASHGLRLLLPGREVR
jgi:hypothetical protein